MYHVSPFLSLDNYAYPVLTFSARAHDILNNGYLRNVKMKAAVYRGKGQIVLEEVDIPEAFSECVIVDNMVTGVCGSDLHEYFGQWDQPRFASGHELTGVVTEVGDDVSGFKPGDRVCVECFSHCGCCRFCENGLYNLCDSRVFMANRGHSGFAEYSLLHESSLRKLPEDMSFEKGALIEPLAVACRAFYRTGADQNDSIAILGGGAIGLLTMGAAKTLGVQEAFISVKYDHQALVAEKMGADHVLQISDQDIKEEIDAVTEGYGVDVVIDTVGSPQAFQEAIEISRKRGKICLVGGYFGTQKVDLAPIVWKELQLVGSNCYGYSEMHRDFELASDLLANEKIDTSLLVTHRFGLDDIILALETAADKTTGSIKVQIQQL
jgi:L-iditol 2-dehydrogenase